MVFCGTDVGYQGCCQVVLGHGRFRVGIKGRLRTVVRLKAVERQV